MVKRITQLSRNDLDSGTQYVEITPGLKSMWLYSAVKTTRRIFRLGTSVLFVPKGGFEYIQFQTDGKRTYNQQARFLGRIPNSFNVTGDGTNYWIGADVALTEIYDINNNFTVGDGAGTGAVFTAPSTGVYTFGITPYIFSDATGGGTVYNISIVTTSRTYIITTNPEQNNPTFNDFTRSWFGGMIIEYMTAGDSARFYFQGSGGLGADSLFHSFLDFGGFVYGALLF